ncbi:hypothetical protein PN497_08955 [Sphaerospermopsis kisseleviana CS-549]|uniref:Uncharacterized protein n=1 Tax=Sphaerospermopsis kisseleviana CS-549 TaxID=3021783 RepID=A0ABT4ZQ07_9CYAN|nr:hypothetical protein [Sphaerospermopsis kisseleviana]MDB9441486.1 hypothetical protein [Sphaerospermopsis kisseleviana CS-549]BAZ83742.1 hypothetical protein NIES73_50310 [Sphaerospermopsis kisseleviana NIES-73]
MQSQYQLAAESLKKYQIPQTVQEGIWYLEEISEQINYLILYKELFPCEWSSSTTPLRQHSYPSVYSDIEIEFLELVNEWLFTIEYHEDFRGCTEKYTEIPVYSQNTDWWEMSLEELSFTEQFLLSIIGYGHPQEDWHSCFGFIPDKLVTVDKINWDKLSSLCQQTTSPLSLLYDVISIIDHSTECIWLDVTHAEYVSFEWEQEVLKYLAEQWQLCQTYCQKMTEFSEWIESSIDHRKQVVKLWNKAQN